MAFKILIIWFLLVSFSWVQLLSCIWFFETLWIAARQASLSLTNSWSLLKLASIESVMPSNCLILCCPLLFLPSIFPSIRVFSNESVLCIRWPKYWSFSFSINHSIENSVLDSFRIEWFPLLAVQGTLKSLLQHHSSKTSSLQCSALFMVQLSHLYMTTGKTIALTRQIFIGKSMSLLFNMLFVIVFLPRGKCLLISQLQSYSTVVLEPKKIKFVTVSIVSPSIHWRDGTRCHDLIFWMLTWVLNQLYQSSLSLSFMNLFSSCSLSPIKVVSSVYMRL